MEQRTTAISLSLVVFLFNALATTEIYTLSLHDALPILEKLNEPLSTVIRNSKVTKIPTNEIAVGDLCIVEEGKMINADGRSEEHTSELQSRENLVCRLLLEKKKLYLTDSQSLPMAMSET